LPKGLLFDVFSEHVKNHTKLMKTEQLTFFTLFDRSTLAHLRIPFSFFLLPVFCFALSQAEAIDWMNVFVVFIALHLFIYPGSNLYNSYTDKDTGSIGGLKNPPPATRKLYYSSIFFDIAGLAICLLINWRMLLLMLVYVAVSKAYSWPGIRLKRYGVIAWMVVALFQGAYTYLMVGMASENTFSTAWISPKNTEAMLLTALLIGGFYPFTQIYQHDEDSSRGDKTLSYRLGIYGTFIF
jgi:1,4-dihydroxy-2-naphthoate octaprenyltransferase